MATSTCAAALTLASPAAAAPRVEYADILSYIPARIDSMIGFIPSHGMNPPSAAPRPTTVRLGGRTFRFVYQNTSVVWPDTRLILRTLARSSGYSAARYGAFVDRRLSAGDRRRLVVRADLGRDADVLAVAADHPVCATGLTLAQARGIARGTIRRWSQVVTLGPGEPDAIAVRVKTDGLGNKEPRWGIHEGRGFASGSRGATDGGLAQAARGDRAVAALTSWSRARTYRTGVCAVPINGVAPTDPTVFELRYSAAFPITYVVARAHQRATRQSRAMMSGFIAWLKGPDAARLFRGRGMLLAADGPPPPPPSPEPEPAPAPQSEPGVAAVAPA